MDDDETSDSRKEGVAYLYLILAGVCFSSTLFIASFVPETKGKHPEDFMEGRVQYGSRVQKGEEDVVKPLMEDTM